MKVIQHKSLCLLMLSVLIGCTLQSQKAHRVDLLKEYFGRVQIPQAQEQVIANPETKSLAVLVSRSSDVNKRPVQEMLDNDQGMDNDFYASISNDLPHRRLVEFIISTLKSKFRQVDFVDSINEAKVKKYDYISVVDVLLQYSDFWGQAENHVELRSIFLNSLPEKVSDVSAIGSDAGDSGHWGPPTQEGYAFYKLQQKVSRDWVEKLTKQPPAESRWV